jgi:6-phosphofructokinase
VFNLLPDFIKKQLLLEREVHGSIQLSQIETERFLSYLVADELAQRKKKAAYKGAFAPVTHFFGYQGRCSFPSNFDATLASTYGYVAGILAENKVTGVGVTARGVVNDVNDW